MDHILTRKMRTASNSEANAPNNPRQMLPRPSKWLTIRNLLRKLRPVPNYKRQRKTKTPTKQYKDEDQQT